MKITIHRGTHQIGGCITEYEQDGWRLFVDCGAPLPGSPDAPLHIEGLTKGNVGKSALFITHYHGDHTGKLPECVDGIPVYMGDKAKKILLARSKHMESVPGNYRQITERLSSVETFIPYDTIRFGPFEVTPFSMDHSAYDAYAFHIKAAGRSVFHTGDFRDHGFEGAKMMKKLRNHFDKSSEKIDCLVCEGTNVSRPQANPKSEEELQQEFTDAFKKNKYNIVYVASTNIDRLISLFHAARKAQRPFYADRYQMDVLKKALQDKKWWLPLSNRLKRGTLQRDKAEGGYRVNSKFIRYLEDKGYVLVARATPKFNNLISRLPGDEKVRYLSMWNGYVKDPACPAYNADMADAVGKDYRYMHTSGHCSVATISNLIEIIQPKTVIPMHTDNPQAFSGYFNKRVSVENLSDGEAFEL